MPILFFSLYVLWYFYHNFVEATVHPVWNTDAVSTKTSAIFQKFKCDFVIHIGIHHTYSMLDVIRGS